MERGAPLPGGRGGAEGGAAVDYVGSSKTENDECEYWRNIWGLEFSDFQKYQSTKYRALTCWR